MSLEVYDVTTVDRNVNPDFSKTLHGRRRILSGEKEVTRENVIDILYKALGTHNKNRAEILFLLDYHRGIQPILNRYKQYNAEINNKIVVNLASEIVTFKSSEFAGEPIQYVSRRGNKGVDDENRDIPEKVSKINDMMLSEGKQTLDLELAHKMFICGTAYRLTYSDEKTAAERDEYLDEAPFEIAIPDVENTFVVYRNDAKKTPLMGVTYTFKTLPDKDVVYTVYAKDATYTIEGISANSRKSGLKIANVVQHNFGMISLIEYPCNPDRIGAFEVVLPLLDAINLTESNRLDGVEQFIQALMVFDGVDIEREDFLKLKDLGAIMLPSTQGSNGGKKLYYLNDQLDQSQTQTLVNDMKKTVLEIVGMPGQGDGNTGDSSNNGAVIMKNGWWHAEGRAMQTQNMWKKAETDFLKVVLKICNDTNTLSGLKVSDLEPRFWRQSYEDLLVKTQSFSTLRTSGMPAIQAFKFSHLSKDPESDAIVYDDYQKMLADELDRLNGITDGLPLKEDDTVNPASEEGVTAQAVAEEGTPVKRSGSGDRSGEWAQCPVCGKRFLKKESNQVYDSIACANKARRDNGIGFRR